MERSKMPSFVTILILTLITAVLWVGFSIYRAIILKPSPSVPANVSATLNPTLDTETISQIESRLFLNTSQIPEVNVASSSPIPTPIVTPVASPSATPIATASAVPTATP